MFTTRSRIKEAHGGIENATKKIHVEIQRRPKAMRDSDNECKYCEHQTDEVNDRQNVQEENLGLLRKPFGDQSIPA